MVSRCQWRTDYPAAAAASSAEPEGDSLESVSVPEIFQNISRWEERGMRQEVDRAFDELLKRPFSFDLIEGIAERGGKPISPAEMRLITRLGREMPDVQRALHSYQLLERETEQMDVARFPKTVIEAGGERFEGYDVTDSEYRFFVHSAGLNEVPISQTRDQRERSGFLCVSLISNERPDFYSQNRQYAMVLAVDPESIALTAREDIFSPYNSRLPETLSYYRFYTRMKLFAGHVNSLHGRVRIQGPLNSEDLSRLIPLLADPRQAESEEAGRLMQRLRLFNPQMIYRKYADGATLLQIQEIGTLPAEERPAEWERVSSLMAKARSGRDFKSHLSPLLGAEELLAQTPFQTSHNDNNMGISPYNEIDLYLPAGRPVQVKAILIDRPGFQKNPSDYLRVLRDAKEKGIAVLIKDLTPKLVARKMCRALEVHNEKEVVSLLSSPLADAALAEQTLLSEAARGMCKAVELILGKWDISDAAILKAFEGADKRNEVAKLLVKARPQLLKEKAWEALFVYDDARVLDHLSEAFCSIEGFGLRAFREALSRNQRHLAWAVYEKYPEMISEEELKKAVIQFGEAPWEKLPPELANWALRFAIENGNAKAALKIGALPSVRASLEGSLAGKLLVVAAETGTIEFFSFLADRPGIPGEAFEAALAVAARSGRDLIVHALMEKKGNALSSALLQALLEMEDNLRRKVLFSLAGSGIGIPPAFAREAFAYSLKHNYDRVADAIYRSHRGEISEEFLKSCLTTEIRGGRFPAGEFSAGLGPWAIGCAIYCNDRLAAELIHSHGRGLPEKEVQELVCRGVECECMRSISALVRLRPEEEQRLSGAALLHAVNRQEYLMIIWILRELNLSPQSLRDAHAAALKMNRQDIAELIQARSIRQEA